MESLDKIKDAIVDKVRGSKANDLSEVNESELAVAVSGMPDQETARELILLAYLESFTHKQDSKTIALTVIILSLIEYLGTLIQFT